MAKYLVTPALPYANGPIHIGHLVEHVQVNTYVRALRMAGEDVLCVCGADCHGAPIEIAALKAGKKPEELARENQESHAATFARFHIDYDGGYGSTHTDENRRHAERIYQALKEGGHLRSGEVEQLQDPTDGRFLADRFVKGTCPKCKAVDQYGDSCEVCGSTYRATELIDPKSVVTGATPVLARSTHIFVKLGDFADKLRAFLAKDGVLHASQRHFLDAWFADGLKDWDVSRDGPYFGFPIPGETNKFFYVWLDAPIGYVSLTERALEPRGAGHPIAGGGHGGLGGGLGAFTGALYDGTRKSWQEYWKDPSTRIEHFIGKDILYFHTLFWPAMLMATGDTLPSSVHVHGMLTVNGTKMSKSRGTFINADALAEVCDPQALRYYYAAKLGAEPNDIDLSFEDFVNRVNADLVNNVVNLVSRTVPQLHRVAGGRPAPLDDKDAVVVEARARLASVAAHYRALDFAGAVRTVVEVGSLANKLLQDTAPWDLAKSDPERARQILTTALWVGKSCLACLKPVVPALVDKLEGMLKVPPFTFDNALAPLSVDVAIGEYVRLFERLDLKKVQSVVKPAEATATAAAPAPVAKSAEKKKAPAPEPPPPAEISIDEFMRVELRAARVVSASAVEGSDKLIAVKLDLGELGPRDIFAGLRPHVAPESLVGRMVVVVANLAPRKMKFGTSYGMMLAAGDVPVPLSAEGAKPGERIR